MDADAVRLHGLCDSRGTGERGEHRSWWKMLLKDVHVCDHLQLLDSRCPCLL